MSEPTLNAARGATGDFLSLPEMEAAINYWRARYPSAGEDSRLCAQASALSRPYAYMIYYRCNVMPLGELDPAARAAWDGYRATCA